MVRYVRVLRAAKAVGSMRREGRVRVLREAERPVSRPRPIVPTNLQTAMVVDGIVGG